MYTSYRSRMPSRSEPVPDEYSPKWTGRGQLAEGPEEGAAPKFLGMDVDTVKNNVAAAVEGQSAGGRDAARGPVEIAGQGGASDWEGLRRRLQEEDLQSGDG